MNTTDCNLGNKVIGYALSLLAWGTACAVAWSCSTLLMGIIMFIIMSLVMSLLAGLAHILIIMKMDASTTEGIGRTVGSMSARVTSMFSRKVPA